MATLAPVLDRNGGLTADGYMRASRDRDPIKAAREKLINGFEAALPGGKSWIDPEGQSRRETRLAWWKAGEPGLTWHAATFDEPVRRQVADDPLTCVVRGCGEVLEETRMLAKVHAALAQRKPPR